MDYSQIEVRVYAKIVAETALLEIFENPEADVYRTTAANMIEISEDEVTEEDRQKAKAIVLGILYGLSAAGLPAYAFKSYGVVIPPDEAEDLIERFFELYPKIAEDHAHVLDDLREDGYVDRQTITGRRRDGITVRNEAINAPIQGSAADGLKLAMSKAYAGLKKFGGSAFIAGAFHDELLVECDEGDAGDVQDVVEAAMLEAMEELLNAEPPKVRIKVSGGVSPVWTK
jgi:DNA polymerase I